MVILPFWYAVQKSGNPDYEAFMFCQHPRLFSKEDFWSRLFYEILYQSSFTVHMYKHLSLGQGIYYHRTYTSSEDMKDS
jgi:hypothetical protein